MELATTTKTPQGVEQELATRYDADQIAFFRECAEKSGMTLEQWMAFEPF